MKEQARKTLTRRSHSRGWTSGRTEVLHPPLQHFCRPPPGSHPHRLARAVPSTRKALLPTLHLSSPPRPSERTPPQSQCLQPLLCGLHARSYLHHNTPNCDCPAGLCLPRAGPGPGPCLGSQPGLAGSAGCYPSPPHTLSREDNRESLHTLVGLSPGPGSGSEAGSLRAGRGCSRGRG